jgi:hypothetical protein
VLPGVGRGARAGHPAFGDDGGFAEGPAEIGIAEFGVAEAFDFAGAGDGAFDQAAVTEEILHAGKAGDIADFVEEGQAEELANAGYWRMRPLVFSLVPRSQAWCGVAKWW